MVRPVWRWDLNNGGENSWAKEKLHLWGGRITSAAAGPNVRLARMS